MVEPIWRGPPKCHVDLYIDDTGFDVLYQDAKACAKKAYLVWQRVKSKLDDAKLPLSAGKSVWICSNTTAEKELNKLLKEGDPQVQSLVKDLGVDSTWGRRRRLATHKARFSKGQQRQKRLVQLAPTQHAKTKACKQSVFGAALYGHMAMGLAPKRLKWIRHQHAAVLGRMNLGSTEAVIEQASYKHDDPAFTIMNQHFRFMHKLLVAWTQSPLTELEVAFNHWMTRIKHHKEPWRIVVGPFGAAACYLKALGWKASSLTKWQAGEEQFDLLDRGSMHLLSLRLKKTCDPWRWKALACGENGQTLQEGIEWQAPRKALKQCKGVKNKALVAVWQGAIRHGKGAWCTRCNQEATLQHVLWECSWWESHLEEPAEFARFRAQYPDPSLWLRGLGPVQARPATYQQVLVEEGVFCQALVEDQELLFATDGSPGASQDARFQVLTWGVVAFVKTDTTIRVVGRAVGPVSGEQTVFRAETTALLYVARKTSGETDVTLDCKGVPQILKRPPGWKSEDLFQELREHSERLQLTWINSHLSRAAFEGKFGAENWWRWQANQEVDRLVQDAANQRRDLEWEQRVLIKDEAVVQINLLLASRAQHIFQSDKDEGPQVVFPAELQDGNSQAPGEKRKSGPKAKQHGVPGKRRMPKVGDKPAQEKAKPRAGEPNKRQQLEALLAGTGPDTGHTWVEGHRSRDNLCIRCSTCGFFVEQVDSKVSFDKKVRHTCEWREPSAPQMGEHPSHQMINGGRMWLCRRCGLRQWVGMVQLASGLAKQCKQIYTGKDQWIVGCIKKSAPKKEGFFMSQGLLRKDPRKEAHGSLGGSNQAPNHTGDGNGDETMLDDAASGVGVALNQITRKAPKLPEVGEVRPATDHPNRSQGDDSESCKGPEGGGREAGGENPLDPAATDKPLGPQVNNEAPKSKAKPKAKGRAKATSEEKGRQTKLKF